MFYFMAAAAAGGISHDAAVIMIALAVAAICSYIAYREHRSRQEKFLKSLMKTDDDTAKYCKKCGKELEDGVKFCGECGAPRGSADSEREKASGASSISSAIVGTAVLVLGVVGTAYGAITINSDKSSLFGYNYEAPLCDHEITTLVILGLGILFVLIGLCNLPARNK